MLVVETIARIRRDHLVRGVPIKTIARDLRVSKNTVRKVVRGDETSYSYARKIQPMPKLGPWVDELERQLEANEKKPRRDRLSLPRIHEDLAALGYGGGYDAVRRYPEHLSERSAFAGIELALWDIAGKEAGLPVYRLLGGAVRERAPFVAYAYTVDPDEGRSPSEIADIMAEIAADGIAKSGAAMFEYKIGLHPPACEIEVARAVRRAAGSGVELAVDANMGFTMEAARRFLAGVEETRLANIEEPVAGLAMIERLRHEFAVPVSTHCIDLDALARYPGIDSVVSDAQLLGGIAATIDYTTRVRALGKCFWLRARWELGVAWAAMCHLGMALPDLERPSQALIDWVEDDLVLGEIWLVRDGGVRPPETPGLGVELDRDALARYAAS